MKKIWIYIPALLVISIIILFIFKWPGWLKGGFLQKDPFSFKIIDAKTEATPIALSLPIQITDKSTYDALSFDPLKKEYGLISYNLSKPGWVRIRIMHRQERDLLLRTLFDWARREFGKNIEKWDGRDESGNIINNKECFILIEANSKIHAKHDRSKCHELMIGMLSPDKPWSKIYGLYNIESAIIEDKGGYGPEAGYKVYYFIDYQLIGQQKYLPGVKRFLFQLDSTNLSNGDHMLTINAEDYHDHKGSVNMFVHIPN